MRTCRNGADHDDCKTGAEHIKSLKDGRTVYIDGKLVDDVTEHPAFRNAVRLPRALYDFQARAENLELMTFTPEGSNRRVNRCWQMPRSHAEMVQRRKALQAWAALHLRLHGPFARPSSRPRWSASAWASTCSRSTGRRAPRRSRDYFEYATPQRSISSPT